MAPSGSATNTARQYVAKRLGASYRKTDAEVDVGREIDQQLESFDHALGFEDPDWPGLSGAADQQIQASSAKFERLTRRQRELVKLRNAANQWAKANPMMVGVRIAPRTLPTWSDLSTQLIQQAAANGIPQDFAAHLVKGFGRTPISFNIALQVQEHFDSRGRVLNHNALATLRTLAGAELAKAIALYNSGPTPSSDHVSTPVPAGRALGDLREALSDSLAIESSKAQAIENAVEKAQAGVQFCAGQVAASNGASLNETVALQDALGDLAEARAARWFLGWPSDSPLSERLHEVSSFDGSPGRALQRIGISQGRTVSGRITSITRSPRGTLLRFRDDRGDHDLTLQGVDIAPFGLRPGAEVEVQLDSQGRVAYTHPSEKQDDWLGHLRQLTRATFIATPFDLSMNWSWNRGDKGAVQQLMIGGWFA